MSDPVPHRFRRGDVLTEVALPFALDPLCDEYDALTSAMSRTQPPDGFSRDEWGYLVSFLRGAALRAIFAEVFGAPVPVDDEAPRRLALPRQQIAVWLPNNVSLLGPLTVALCLLTGARVRAKSGSGAEDLTVRLRDFILGQDPGPNVTALWRDHLDADRFSRSDPRNRKWSETADARIFFGGNAAAQAVEALPHKPGTPFFAFADHSSIIWAETEALTDQALTTIFRVFQIYGKIGCTSPQRVVLIEGDPKDTTHIAKRLKAIADNASQARPPVHIASDSFMAAQVARAKGWQSYRTETGGAVFLAGGAPGEPLPGLMSLAIDAMPLDAAAAALPANIQTVGHVASSERLAAWLPVLARTPTLRVVPARQMHHFGPFWDGQAFWQGLFRFIDVKA